MSEAARPLMTQNLFSSDLIRRLPQVRGKLTENAPLGPTTWFRVGGPAEVLFRPADLEDLEGFLAGCPLDIPVTVIGVASNLLVRDGGVPGVVIRLGKEFANIEMDGDKVMAGAGALDMNVAQAAAEAGVGGLEFLSGIPGTIGGAIRMNAGAYGSEMTDVMVTADVLDRQGLMKHLSPGAMNMSYRKNAIPENVVFTGCTLKGRVEDPKIIQARMAEIKAKRSSTQPIREKTGGSTFANPPGDKKAWQLIDEADCRGFKIGGAQMSEMHCNFMINTNNATAADLERLGETVIRRVREKSGITLHWEIKRIGQPLKEDWDLMETKFEGRA